MLTELKSWAQRKTKVNEKLLSYIKKYGITLSILGASSLLILFLREYSAADEAAKRFLNLADAFTIPGVIMLMVGIMAWVSTTGTFDIFTYAFSRAKNSFFPSPNFKDERFYDFKVKREKKRIKGYSFLFISGGIYMIPAVVFNILYYTAK